MRTICIIIKMFCRYITECFTTGENELHPENYGQAFDEIRTLAMSYNYPAIWDDWYDMTPRYGGIKIEK